jgi:hypothetical protein
LNKFKGEVKPEIKPEITVWQKSFNDRIIRDEKGYLEVLKYIDENPLKPTIDKVD